MPETVLMTQILPVACLAESQRTDAGQKKKPRKVSGINVFGHVGVQDLTSLHEKKRAHACSRVLNQQTVFSQIRLRADFFVQLLSKFDLQS
jgi:hypothetical protein